MAWDIHLLATGRRRQIAQFYLRHTIISILYYRKPLVLQIGSSSFIALRTHPPPFLCIILTAEPPTSSIHHVDVYYSIKVRSFRILCQFSMFGRGRSFGQLFV